MSVDNYNNEMVFKVPSITPLFPEREEKGNVIIERFKWDLDPLYNLRTIRDNGEVYKMYEGVYTKLLIDGKLMMSDTIMERKTNREFVKKATGDVLIAGLGLIIQPLLEKEEVTSITVIELNQNVIDLVGPKFQHEKLKIVQGDCFKYTTKERYDTIYLDIWSELSTDLIKGEMEPLLMKYNKFLKPKVEGKSESWIDCWMLSFLKEKLSTEVDMWEQMDFEKNSIKFPTSKK